MDIDIIIQHLRESSELKKHLVDEEVEAIRQATQAIITALEKVLDIYNQYFIYQLRWVNMPGDRYQRDPERG